jgi:DNA-binding transcriptional ArsR family regulator
MLLSEKERKGPELCSDLGMQSQPALSHHLALLRVGGVIGARRAGKENVYASPKLEDSLLNSSAGSGSHTKRPIPGLVGNGRILRVFSSS